MGPTSADSLPAPAQRVGEHAVDWAVARRIEAGGIAVRFREAGSGPPVVLVHGLGVSADYWWRNGPPLADAGLRALAPDLPGFGRTAGPPGGLSVPEQATALLQWIDALALPAVTLVGHSISCQTAIELAARAPDRVAALVLAGPTGDPRPRRLLHQAIGLVRDVPRESLRLAVEVGIAYLRAGPPRVWRTWWMGARHELAPLLPAVRAPGLVVVGSRDPVVRRDFARGLADALPNGRLCVVDGAPHAVIFSHAERFNAALLDFLRENGVVA